MRAWALVVSMFCLFAVVLGTFYSYGLFLSQIKTEFGTVNAVASWLFAMTLVIFSSTGMVGGAAVDKYGARIVVFIGMVCFGAGLYLTSRSTSIYQAFAFYALSVGIGSGCAYVPLLTVIGKSFGKKRALANAIAVSGVGLGTAVMSYLIASLLSRYGWRQAYVIVAGLGVVPYLGCLLLLNSNSAVRAGKSAGAARVQERPIDWRSFKRLYAANLVSTVIQLVPFIFLATYAKSLGISEVSSSLLIGTVGVTSVVGRLALGIIASRFGVIRPYKASMLAMALAYVLWFASSYLGPAFYTLVLFAGIFGFAYGLYLASFPGLLAEFFGVQNLGVVMGRSYTAGGVGAIIGLPLLGFMLDVKVDFTVVSLLMLALGTLAYLIVMKLTPSEGWAAEARQQTGS